MSRQAKYYLTAFAFMALVAPIGLVAQTAPTPNSTGVGALGRLQPKDGVRRIAGPSEVVLVLADLLVDIGDRVKPGQVIARLDDYASREAAVARFEASLAAETSQIARLESTMANARVELERSERLAKQGLVTPSQLDQSRLQVEVVQAQLDAQRSQVLVAKANLKQGRVDLERRIIRSPISGTVLRVYARAGEKVGSEGILELGQTDLMYAVAEVYETDISQLRIGQRARVSSPVLSKELTGVIDRIALTVGKKRVQDDDPGSRKDARVVEVEVRLDDAPRAARFTNLQVQVRFERQ